MSVLWMDNTQREDIQRLSDDEYCDKYQPSGAVLLWVAGSGLVMLAGLVCLLNWWPVTRVVR